MGWKGCLACQTAEGCECTGHGFWWVNQLESRKGKWAPGNFWPVTEDLLFCMSAPTLAGWRRSELKLEGHSRPPTGS